jgi:hypothetical protein
MAHGRDDDVSTAVAIATAATAGAAGLPEPMWVLCHALIESSLGDAARKTFAMLPQGQRFFSETQRRWFAEGETEGKAQAVLLVLEGRGLLLSPEQREQILGCSDVATLNRWLKKAATVASAEHLFA